MIPPDHFKTLHIDIKETIGYLILNRPDRLNALSPEMLQELVEAARWFDQQPNIRIVVLKGNGRAFSAGADLKAAAGPFEETGNWVSRREQTQIGHRMTSAIAGMRAITIAQVHGYAIGGAFLLMLACDFRIAAEGTIFSIPEIDLGIPLTWGGIPRLVAEIGPAKTKELVMTCRRFDAVEAESLRILNRIVSLQALESTCLSLAKDLAAKPVVPLQMTKEQVHAVTKQMGEAYLAAAEGDMLLSVLRDPESQRAAEAYRKKSLKG